MTATAAERPKQGFTRFVRDSAVYSIGTVIGKAAALLILPIVTRALGPNEYGELEVISTLMSACTSILILGLDVAVTRTFPSLDEAGRRRMFGTWIAIALAITLPFAAVLAFARAPLSDIFFDYQNMAEEIALAGLFVVVTTIQLITLTVLRNQGRAGRFAIITGGALIANAVLVVLFLQREDAVRSVLLANVISQALGAMVGLGMTHRRLRGRPSVDTARGLLRLGLPLLPASIALLGGEVLYRTILFNLSSDAEAGYFGIAVRFSSVSVLVVMGLQTAWHPRAFAALAAPDGLQSIAADAQRILALIALSAVAVSVVAPSAVVFVSGEAFAGAGAAVGWMLVWALIFGVYQIVTIPSAIDERMGDIGFSGTVGTGIAVLLTVVLAGPHGAAGTAAAMTVGQAVAVLVALRLARKRADVPFAAVRMISLAAAAIVIILVATFQGGVLIRVALAGAFVVALVAEGSLAGATDLVRRRNVRS